jgi:hypothetical protein
LVYINVSAWTDAVFAILGERRQAAPSWLERRALGQARIRRFSWSNHVPQLVAVYRKVLDRHPSQSF